MTSLDSIFVKCPRCSMPVKVTPEVGPVTFSSDGGQEATITITPLIEEHFCYVGPVKNDA